MNAQWKVGFHVTLKNVGDGYSEFTTALWFSSPDYADTARARRTAKATAKLRYQKKLVKDYGPRLAKEITFRVTSVECVG